MNRILNLQTTKKIGEQVLIKGWVKSRRNMGKIVFLDMRDRSGILQIVIVPGELNEESRGLIENIRPEFVLEIKGQVNEKQKSNPNLATGAVEVLAKEIKVLAEAETLPYDLDQEMKLDTYLADAPLNYRNEKAQAIFKVQSNLVAGFREELLKEDFTEFQCPKIVAGATEGGANVFTIDYFKHKAYLAQSPQFYKQIMVGIYERVFTTGNVYRAEQHDTNRHINEYTSLDFEMGFIEDYTDIMKMTEQVLKTMLKKVEENCIEEKKILDFEIPQVPVEFPVLKLLEAQEILEKEYNEKCLGEPDLEPHQEKQLCEYSKKTWNSDFLFITHYPTSKRPMYTMPDSNNKELTLSFDLLFKGTEIVTGGQRINSYKMLVDNMKAFNLKPEEFEFYLKAFKYGMPAEGGIGMGLERVTSQLLNLPNIKYATLFPRDQVRIDELLN